MNFKNFEENIDKVILDRGKIYFKNGYVTSLEEKVSGIWNAEVEGSDDYKITIRCDKNTIKSWDCDCPYDMGNICKHVAAAIYAIAEQKGITVKGQKENQINKSKVKPEKTSSLNYKKILLEATKEELDEFILREISKDKKFKNSFIIHFAEKADESADIKYIKIIDDLFKIYSDRYGFIDYRNERKFSHALHEMYLQAEKLSQKNNVKESLSICKIMIEKIPGYLSYADDSSGGLSNVFQNTFKLFSSILIKAPPMLKDDFFNYCMNEFQKNKYHNIEFEQYFLELIPVLISTEEQEKDFFKFIEDRINIDKNLEYSDFKIARLKKAKIEYYILNDQKTKAEELIRQDIQYQEFREILVNIEIERKNFETAKELCLEGIRIADKNSFYGYSSALKEKLLSIAVIENNIDDIRKWSENNFFDSKFNFKYYLQLKSTYDTDQWKDAYSIILKKMKKKFTTGGGHIDHAYANIFREENLPDNLLELLMRKGQRIEFIDEYSEFLMDIYPEEVISAYKNAIQSLAVYTDRRNYIKVGKYMKKLNSLKGSDVAVNELLDYFKTTFKRRTAMMEILNKTFPGHKF
ncbi:MAG TPA: SWIM zinc finger family protein [Ignavibacteria bacterium]|nr:SWIM zinc finger family protein [Ignavibacteria bacterium]HMR39639.1 SWIM zinc finger family protein [Ignavibacteria bacterium]